MLWFCCLPVASLIVGRVQRSNLSKSGSEAHYSSTFTIMIKTKIHPHALLVHGWSLFWFMKAKKITDIPQTQAGFKAKSLGILCGFQGFLTQNPAALVEIDDIFAFSDTPWDRGLSVSLGSAGSFYFASGGRTGKHSGFLVGWNDGLGWIFVQGGRTEFPPADYDIPHIHPINNLWGGISPSRRGEPCWFVLCPLKYLQETMLLLRAVPRGVERCRGAAERTGRCLHLSPQMLEG